MRYLTLLILLAGCAQNNSGSSSGSAQALAATQSKVLFSSWYSADTQNTLDLTNAKLPDSQQAGIGQMNVTLADGSQCVTLIQLSGDGISGSFTIWHSTSVLINGSSTLLNTAACEALNSAGVYSVSGQTLALCRGGSCENLH